MAFAPRQPAPCYVLLFLCIAAWGSYAPLRRTSKSIAGSTFGTLAFLAELTWACTACFVGGSLGGDRGVGQLHAQRRHRLRMLLRAPPPARLRIRRAVRAEDLRCRGEAMRWGGHHVVLRGEGRGVSD